MKQEAKSIVANWTRRGLSRIEAAHYVGVSPAFFDKLVFDGRMPKPFRLNARVIWDQRAIDTAFDALTEDDDGSGWERIAA